MSAMFASLFEYEMMCMIPTIKLIFDIDASRKTNPFIRVVIRYQSLRFTIRTTHSLMCFPITLSWRGGKCFPSEAEGLSGDAMTQEGTSRKPSSTFAQIRIRHCVGVVID